jgi:hypothetical protein
MLMPLSLFLVPILVKSDLSTEHLGPCVIWEAKTEAGAEFLKTLPERFRSTIEPTGERVKYDPKSKTLMTSPALQTELRQLAKEKGLLCSPGHFIFVHWKMLNNGY